MTAPIPPASPGDQLVGRVIVAVAGLAFLAVSGIIGLALCSLSIPDVLENVAVGSVTGLVALLAGRGVSTR